MTPLLTFNSTPQTPQEVVSNQTTSGIAPGEETTAEQREHWVPFNLSNLRKHLAQVALARRVLPEDVASRQKLLEDSVYDVAVERWKHQEEVFENMGFGNSGLKNADLQAWMWDWHQKLRERLREEIKEVVKHEDKLREYLLLLCVFRIWPHIVFQLELRRVSALSSPSSHPRNCHLLQSLKSCVCRVRVASQTA